MLGLAVRNVVHHRASTIATGIIAVIGVALVSAMAALLATGLAASEPSEYLTVFPVIVGGWIVAIVVFATVSTVSVTLEGRARELTGIRLIGAEPRQVRTIVVVETTLVFGAAALPGGVVGYALGAVLFTALRQGGLAGTDASYAPDVILSLLGAVVVLLAAVVAGVVCGRRPARGSVLGHDETASGRAARSGRGRVVAAAVLTTAGLASSVACLAFSADDVLTTATTGPGCVLVAVGLSLFAREQAAGARRLLRRFGRRDAAAWLAVRNLAAAPERARPLVTFLTLFVGIAAGTLAMQAIEGSAGSISDEGRLIATINYLVVGLLATFMAVALVNNLVAAVMRRRPELGTMRLVGAAPGQSRAMLLHEAAATSVVSIAVAAVGAVASTVPYAVVKTGGGLSALAPAPYALVGAVGLVLVLAVVALCARRAVPGR